MVRNRFHGLKSKQAECGIESGSEADDWLQAEEENNHEFSQRSRRPSMRPRTRDG
jgi:hypothetical protein